MAYKNFKDLKKTVQQFGLTTERNDFFPNDLKPIKPSAWLIESIDLAFNVLTIEPNYYVVENLPRLLSVLQFIFDDCFKNKPL